MTYSHILFTLNLCLKAWRLCCSKNPDLLALHLTVHHPNSADSCKTFCSRCFIFFFSPLRFFFISSLYEQSVYGYAELSGGRCVL